MRVKLSLACDERGGGSAATPETRLLPPTLTCRSTFGTHATLIYPPLSPYTAFKMPIGR
jgi:hypothetical protein